MSLSTLRLILVIIFCLHGIGHLMGLLAVLGVKISPTHSSYSWLLSGVIHVNVVNIICSVISVAAFILFVGSGLMILDWFGMQPYWQKFALYAAIISLFGLILFWNSYPFFIPNKLGVIVLDLLTITSIVWMKWPQDLIG